MNVKSILENGMTNIDVVFSRPNSGGCGYIAQAMANVLTKLNVDVKVVLVCTPGFNSISRKYVDRMIERHDASDINDLYAKILPKYKRFGDIDPLNRHLAVEVAGQLYDSTGALNNGWAISEALTMETLAALIAAPCWNDVFKYANDDIADIPAEMLLQVTNQFNQPE